jgi:hypothetical protein
MLLPLDKLAELVTKKAPPEEVFQLLREAVSDAYGSIRAFRHPFGFVHFQLGSSNDRRVCRLHVWPRERQKVQAETLFIHNHVYEFVSLVLRGQLTDSRFGCHATDEVSRHKFFSVRYENDVSILEQTENFANVELIEILERLGSSYYSVTRNDFHSVVVAPGKFAASLVVASPPSTDRPLVIGPSDVTEPFRFQREDVSAEFRSELLSELFA